MWNRYLVRKLVNEVGFVQSKVDECIFFKRHVMYLLYNDNSILAGPSQGEINDGIAKIKKANPDITVEGDIKDFLGVNMTRHLDGLIELTQPHLIDKYCKIWG